MSSAPDVRQTSGRNTRQDVSTSSPFCTTCGEGEGGLSERGGGKVKVGLGGGGEKG